DQLQYGSKSDPHWFFRQHGRELGSVLATFSFADAILLGPTSARLRAFLSTRSLSAGGAGVVFWSWSSLHAHSLVLRLDRPWRQKENESCKESAQISAPMRRTAPLHSMTSSARSKNDSGMVRPSALAVVKLMTRSNLVGCSTGRSAGFAPRR